MHFLVRKRSADALGQEQTTAIERDVIERLKKAYGDAVDGRRRIAMDTNLITAMSGVLGRWWVDRRR